MTAKHKESFVYDIYLPKSSYRTKPSTIGTITATSPKEALTNFKAGQGNCFYPNILSNLSLCSQLKVRKAKHNYHVYFYSMKDDKKIKVTVGYVYAYSARQAITALPRGQGRLIRPEAYQSGLLRDRLQAEIV